MRLKRFKNEFRTSIPPNYQKVCESDNDYFDLIKYCWECIGDVSESISNINFYKEDGQYELVEYKKSIHHLHVRIEECYSYLKKLGVEVEAIEMEVFTAPIGHNRRRK